MSEKTVKPARSGPKKEDRRVRRTKKLLTQGLFRLMRTKQPKDITVRELADECDINRGTFYLYYRDIFDMLDKVEAELFEKIDTILDEGELSLDAKATYPILKEIFSFAGENREICQVLLSERGDIAFLEKLNVFLRAKCLTAWQKTHQPSSEEAFDISYAFVIFGCIGILRQWVNSEHPIPAEQAAKLADSMLHHGPMGVMMEL